MTFTAADIGHIAFVVLKWAGIAIGAFLILVVLGSVFLPPLTRSRTDRWGATDAEVASSLPGDELVVDPAQKSTKAITIDAPADTVYSLLVQMGYQRGGWYGWDWFYNMTGSGEFVGGSHAEEIMPELQGLKVGDRMYINKMIGYEVLEATRPEALVMAVTYGPEGTHVTPDTVAEYGGTTWTWVVRDNGDGTSRLLLRTLAGGSQGAFVDWLFDNPLDLGGAVMGHKTLVGIRNTAEMIAGNR